MNFVAKEFNELTTKELYEILKARAKVFIVEQGIQCQDMDDVDYGSLHCYYEEDGIVTAYLRAYQGADNTEVQIGRVLTIEHGKGFGKQLMECSIRKIEEKFRCKKICLDAQTHAIGFYEKLGFQVSSDEFLEEGIPHVKMEKKRGDKNE